LTDELQFAKFRWNMEFKRLFTPSDAERTLPLVRQIVSDVLETGRRIRELGSEENADELPTLEAELEEHLRELEAIGCFYKDWNFTVGLVDFPAEIDGETVFLCWRSDEPELGWYHPMDQGYQGRRPLRKAAPTE
jgi:hypothetical protein